MNLTFFIFYCFVATITPGPNNILILSTVNNHGVQKALKFCYGSILAFGILLVLSVVLNSYLNSLLPNILFVMQIIGSIYMLYLAYLIFNMNGVIKDKKGFATFKVGFFMQFINPKGVVFSLTIFPSFVMPYYSSIDELLLFALGVTFIGAISFFSWVMAGSLLKTFLEKYQRFANIVMSLFLVYCAYAISGIENYF
ncbi:LysE family translocator [Aliarcobacter butzleri]|uniref:LysE family translocator n=1 Tax=Aliarcobacter butzleri TaxID=28197 RepID=UPI001EDAFE4D|nr:LysE family transporter [Aliarcobacter butzleri]MCG3671922.1 LysE family transporter [Aliarcobacter butzleri]